MQEKSEPYTRSISAKVTPTMYEDVKKYAAAWGMTAQDVFRQAIASYIWEA